MSIVVTATSGHLGRLIVSDLLARGVPAADVVAGARRPGAVDDLVEAGVRTAVIDYDDPATVRDALDAGDVLVLVSGNDLARRDRQHADAVAAAAGARVARIVYTSGLRAEESPSPIAASHAVTESAVRASGVPFTITRHGWYTENYASALVSARESGVLLASVGDGRVASATRADLARAIGAVATSSGHEGSTYELSGDVAWDYTDLAAAFSEVLGREVAYQPADSEQHARALVLAGVPEQFVGMAVGADAGIRDGAFAFTNGDLSRLLGRPTTSLVEGLRPLV